MSGWATNDRGAGYTFGADIVTKFTKKHDLDLICRGHQACCLFSHQYFPTNARALLQVVEDGFEFFAKRRLVTLFSAPNYCGEFDNAAAMMSVDGDLVCSFQVRDQTKVVCREVSLAPILTQILRPAEKVAATNSARKLFSRKGKS